MGLFGTDGVRGLAGKKLTPFVVSRLAIAAGIFFRNNAKTNKILVGKDTRRSGYMIENALVSGLTAAGYNVVQIGPMPTPAIAFITTNMRCDAGIMISASHNPFEDNGIKFFDAQGNKLSPEFEKEIEAIFEDEERINQALQTGHKIGSSKRIDDVIGRYIVHIKSLFPRELALNNVRIVVDTANGAAYKVAPTILSELGADLVVVANEPNGFNINEDCGAMHPQKVAKEVKRVRADVGFALDGDADRLVVIDENGDLIDGDNLLGALALSLKEDGLLTGGACVATVMSNGALEEFLNLHDIKLFRSDVGDKHVLDLMHKHGVNFGGEQSGHVIYSDFARTGDGLVTALLVLKLMLQRGKKASELLNPFKPHPQKQGAVNITKKQDLSKNEELQKLLKEIENDHIRHLIRYSGTENKLRILLEGKDENRLEEWYEKVVAVIKKTHE